MKNLSNNAVSMVSGGWTWGTENTWNMALGGLETVVSITMLAVGVDGNAHSAMKVLCIVVPTIFAVDGVARVLTAAQKMAD